MEKRQERTVLAFEQILLFLESNPMSPEPPLMAGMKRSLQSSIAKISRLGAEQVTAMDLRVAHVEHDRGKLRRERMMPLVRIAKPLLRFAPGVEKALRVPHARDDAVTVANAAIQMARLLKPHRKLLASAGVSATFLEEMQHEARELALAAKHTAAARQKLAQATSAMAREFKKAMQTVTVIEGMVMLHFAGEREMLKLWRDRRRVSARIGRPPQRKARGRPEPIAIPPSPPEATLTA